MERAIFLLGQTTLTELTKRMEANQLTVLPVDMMAGSVGLGQFELSAQGDGKFVVQNVTPPEMESNFACLDTTPPEERVAGVYRIK